MGRAGRGPSVPSPERERVVGVTLAAQSNVWRNQPRVSRLVQGYYRARQAIRKGVGFRVTKHLELERQALLSELAAEYWAFSRQAKAPPPSGSKHRRLWEIEVALGLQKEHWQRTPDEAWRVLRMPASAHRLRVFRAFREGKTIPAEVLDCYPELSASTKRIS